MAVAYTQTTGFLAILNRIIENSQDIHEKETLHELTTIIDTEFAKMESDGLAGYTVTSDLNASMDARLINMANTIKRRIIEEFNTIFTTECASVVTNGLGYTTTTSLSAIMKRIFECWPNVQERIMLFEMIDRLDVEWALCVLASA